jgi:hypothetical protein
MPIAMTIPTSTKKKDAGRISGPASCANVCEIMGTWTLPNGRVIHGAFHGWASPLPSMSVGLANTLFGAFSSAWSTNLATYMHTGTSFNGVAIRDMTSPTNPIFLSTSAAVAGTSSSTVAMPESMAIVLTENLNVRGRGAKGRVYLGGWSQSADVTTGGISSTVQAALNAFGTAVLNGINSNGMIACLAQVPRQQYIGYSGTNHPARPAGHPVVSSYTCRDLVWDTQRRRVQL